MTDAELDLLVARIGAEFLARLGKPAPAPAASGYDAPAPPLPPPAKPTPASPP
jgi:hypothetical protein